MAGTQKLTVGGNTVTIYPRAGYEEPNMGRITHRDTLGGVTYSYIWYYKDSFQVVLNNISATDAASLEGWRVLGQDIQFIPDFDVAPGTSITVRITDKTNPLRMMAHQGFNTTALYEGVVTLRKTTAN